MELTRFDDAAEFSRRAEPFLLAHEAEHNLMLGICSTLLQQPGYYESAPYLALVAAGEEVVAVAMRTSPYNPVLSLIPDAARATTALELLTRNLLDAYGQLSGVLGPTAVSRAFAEQWQHVSGQPYHPGMRQRIYQLDEVTPVAGVPGCYRGATEADRDLLVHWLAAFGQEALGGRAAMEPERWVDQAFATPTRGVSLWEDGEPVALAAYGNPTPHGIRIGPVYTPPERRRRGYASACVAALSQQLLDEGRRFCFLFTDLSNPTSNHIYQAIGYRPVGDVDEYQFDAVAQHK
jgi:predicted GNAT family acetyltransferase